MHLQPDVLPKPTRSELAAIEVANERAVAFGPMLALEVSWLPNGLAGSTLPDELISVGRHIVHPERMPAWLIDKLAARETLPTAALHVNAKEAC